MASVAVPLGCGKKEDQPEPLDRSVEILLEEVGELYRLYQIIYLKPPSGIEDLVKFGEGSKIALDSIRVGRVILFYGIQLPSLDEKPGDGSSDLILAYLNEVPQSGGGVLMLDRTVRLMSANEFKSAKKAGQPPGP